MRDLVPFIQFKKPKKHPRRNDTFSQSATLLKVTLLHWCFSRFLNCTNGTKSRNASHIKGQYVNFNFIMELKINFFFFFLILNNFGSEITLLVFG